MDSGKKGTASAREERPTALASADPIRNFSLPMEERIRALTIGVPAWAARKRRIEDAEVRFVEELVARHDHLVALGRGTDAIALALQAAASAIDLAPTNALVDKHNRYYPIEANLPLDRRTGEYLVYGRIWVPEKPYTAARLLARARAFLARRDRDGDDD